MDLRTRRFACTRCGSCCNRSPEVELSEANTLADVFVFRLLFRIYSLPLPLDLASSDDRQRFYERKRLLNTHAARTYEVRTRHGHKSIPRRNYLMISALAIGGSPGACSALSSSDCTIYERRPLTCRTVPFHYSRGESLALDDLDTFVRSPGYRCDISDSAPVVLERGVIVDPPVNDARSQALAVAKQDLAWKQAIVRAMKTESWKSLPSLADVEMNAAMAAMTTSMRVAWEIAASADLLPPGNVESLLLSQVETIGRELRTGSASAEDRQTLAEMNVEYRAALER